MLFLSTQKFRAMSIKKLFLVGFWSVVGLISAQCPHILQDLNQPSANGVKVVMAQDSLIAHLITLQQQVNVQNGKTVFRVQLYRGSNQASRREAAAVKAMFLEKYPNQEVFTPFDAPYWRVRVGTFETYNEALKLRKELEKELSTIKEDIYIVSTKINN